MIFQQLSEQLAYLEQLLDRLTPEQYTYRSRYLSNSTIGGHTRHILELLHCAIKGYEAGEADYQNRQRNLLLEQDITMALGMLHQLEQAACQPDKKMILTGDGQSVVTSYYREIVYNIEHTIHHLAIMKVALIEMDIREIDQNFGLAYATIKYNEQKVQARQV